MAEEWAVVLVMCGSFSPVHRGHLRAFEIARQFLTESTPHAFVRGILSPVSDAYNKNDLVPAAERLAMLQLAVGEEGPASGLEVDEWEALQGHYTPTLQVLRHIQERIGDEVDGRPVRVMLLCGADLLASFLKPGVWAEEDMRAIAKEFGFVVLTRDESMDIGQIVEQSPALSSHSENIIECRTAALRGISSTSIRAMVRNGEDCTTMTYPSVAAHIREKRLWA